MIDDDKDTINNIINGDIDAFEIIIKKYQLRIINLCFKYTKNYSDAEEVAQESFFKAFSSLKKFRFESKFYSWLHRIAINCSLNFINSKEKTKERETISENFGLSGIDSIKVTRDIESPFDNYNMVDLAQTIENAYEVLPEELKLVVKLRDIDDMSYDEIAKITSMPIGTVKSRLHRARDILIKKLNNEIDDE
jgi:RNA polymerase sigma-70 factor, ECF subfamily